MSHQEQAEQDYDFIIIGSGFGGSVSALRLAEKGYRVLVIEKGKRWRTEDFPRRNWYLRRWLWLPFLRFFGFFKITWFRHVTVLSGVGVGGGSLVYANTLPLPKPEFFKAPSWAHLADWEAELRKFYPLATRMLGATTCPRLETGDIALRDLARDLGKEANFEPTKVAVFFGEPEKTVPDPYFGGKGPERAGCTFCGGCMVGCRFNAKNTLDRNYLYLAEKAGATIQPESEVVDVRPLEVPDGSAGYKVRWRTSTRLFGPKGTVTARGVVFAGGVLGTVPLLLKLKRSSLPNLSDKIGAHVRTNSESLIGVTTFNKDTVFSDGVAISSILHFDEHSHLEPVRYPAGSGFWRLLGAPLVSGRSVASRILGMLTDIVRRPIRNFKVFFVDDWAKRTQILLFMRTLDSTLRFTKGLFGMGTQTETGSAPPALMPEAKELAERYGNIVNGKPMVLLTETLFSIPTTAHILGGAVMGKDREEGVIDKDNKVFGYQNLYVCDGSMISANPGVNPSLTITALTERAMSMIAAKEGHAMDAEIGKSSALKKSAVILLHAFAGWLLCGATMGIGLSVTTVKNALIAHMIGAPLFFSLVSWIYFSRFNYTSPLRTASIFIGFVIFFDFFVVALLINRSLDMFADPLGTWIPFTLIFAATYATGILMKRRR